MSSPHPKPFTQEQIDDYIDHKSNKCPECGTKGRTELDYTEILERETARGNCFCLVCGTHWVEVYTLTSIQRSAE
jgi:hypothetical protein